MRNETLGMALLLVAGLAVGCGGGGGGGSTSSVGALPGAGGSGGGASRTDPTLEVLDTAGGSVAEPVPLAAGSRFEVQWDSGTSDLYFAELSVWDASSPNSDREVVLERNCNMSGVTDCNGAVGLYGCRVDVDGVLTCADNDPSVSWNDKVDLTRWVRWSAPGEPVLQIQVCDAVFLDCRTAEVPLDLSAF